MVISGICRLLPATTNLLLAPPHWIPSCSLTAASCGKKRATRARSVVSNAYTNASPHRTAGAALHWTGRPPPTRSGAANTKEA